MSFLRLKPGAKNAGVFWGIEAVRSPPRIQVTDSPRRGILAHDVVISAATEAEVQAAAMRTARIFGADLGRRWTGDMTESGQALGEFFDSVAKIGDRASMRDAINKALGDIAKFGGELESGAMGAGPAESLSTAEDEERGGREEDVTGHKVRASDSARARVMQRDDGTQRENVMDPAKLNEINAQFWKDRDPIAAARESAGRNGLGAHATPESINAANRAYWDSKK